MSAVRLRILLILAMLATAFLAAGFGWQAMERQKGELLSANDRRERRLLIERILRLQAAPLETMAGGLATSEDLPAFVRKPNAEHARRNIDPQLATFQATGVWIFDRRFRPVYRANARRGGDTAFPLPASFVRRLFEGRADGTFYVRTPEGVLEVRGTRLYGGDGRTNWYGCALIGRLWDADYLMDLGSLTGTTIHIQATGLAGLSAATSDAVTLRRDLPGWNGAPVAQAEFTSDSGIPGSVRSAASGALGLFVVFAALIFGLLSLCLVYWVGNPLAQIASALRTHDAAVLSGLRDERTEFGELARLVSAFFNQQELLQIENTDRREAQEALSRARDELEIRVQERTAALALANTALAREIEERKQAGETIRVLNTQLERRLQRLGALRRIDLAIASTLDLRLILKICLDQVTEHLDADCAAVLLPRTDGGLEYSAIHGVKVLRGATVRAPQGQRAAAISEYAHRAVVERRIVHVEKPEHVPAALTAARPELASAVGYYAAPLIAKDRVQGVLEILLGREVASDPEWFDFLEMLAGQIAIAIDNATLFADLQRSNRELTQAYDATIEGWSRALDLRDKETEGHSRRVTEMSLRLADAIGMSDSEIVHVRRGALLHDIGKISIPDGILLKPGPLDDSEWVIMKRHPQYAYEMLSPIAFLRPALDIPYCHHEKWDGTGYPRGLEGEDIPLAARIFAVVDVWDALRSDRPYRAGWSEERVLAHIQSLSGTHFDPRVVEAFLQVAALQKVNNTLTPLPKAA